MSEDKKPIEDELRRLTLELEAKSQELALDEWRRRRS
ncbi:MAG: hypothetical protein ACI8XB_002372 [Patiriisocius sp.]|jgi:hypothetical protein